MADGEPLRDDEKIARHSTIAAVLILVIAASTGVATAQRRTPSEPNYDAFYELGPDSLVCRGVPKGKVAGPFTLASTAFSGSITTTGSEVRAINQHIRFVADAKPILTAQSAGASDAMRRWRMP